ncbi:MAG: hypothetical protein ABL949_03595 [Fimbriimonadaceae bacterium]
MSDSPKLTSIFLEDNRWAMQVPWDEDSKELPAPEVLNVSHEAHALASRIALTMFRVQVVKHDTIDLLCSPIDLKTDLMLIRADVPAQKLHKVSALASVLSAWVPDANRRNNFFFTHYGIHQNYIRLLYRVTSAWWIRLFDMINAERQLSEQEQADILKQIAQSILDIEVTFGFGPYSSEPGHEPGGVLNAARLIPLVSFRTNSEEIQSVRIDVTMDLAMTTPHSGMPLDETQCLALASRDFERLYDGTPRAISGVLGELLPVPVRQEDAFIAARVPFVDIEKPLTYELLTRGLYHGKPNFSARKTAPFNASDTNFLTWDTVHFWPGRKQSVYLLGLKVGEYFIPELPSAPGAFYALHCHWRWSYGLQYPDSGDIRMAKLLGISKELGGKQFKGERTFAPDGKPKEVGGALLDPNILDQTITIAILKTKANWRLQSDQVNFSFEDWFGQSNEIPTKLDKIDDGHALTWIMSFNAHRTFQPGDSGASSDFGGSTFIHGTYFAHNFHEPLTPSGVLTKGAGHADAPNAIFRFPLGEHLPLPHVSIPSE